MKHPLATWIDYHVRPGLTRFKCSQTILPTRDGHFDTLFALVSFYSHLNEAYTKPT